MLRLPTQYRVKELLCLFLCVLLLPVVPWQASAQTPGAPTQLNIVIVESEGAINNIRQRTSREAIVQVEDENHKPVAGAAVTFLLPNSGAGGSFAGSKSLTVLTDAQGRAAARGFQPNNVAGKFQIRVNASYQNLRTTAAINQTNVAAAAGAAAAGGLGAAKIFLIIAIAGAAAAGGAVAATRGGNGAAPVRTQPTVITPGTGAVGAP